MTEFVRQILWRVPSHEPDAPTLEVEGISVSYITTGKAFAGSSTAVIALENVSFRADVGEQIAIVGPNGAGKSTLLKLVAGIVKPDRGHVEMHGCTPDRHICIAYVPQRSEIDWTFPATVADVVMMGRTRHIGLFRRTGKHDHEIVRASLERVQAWHLAKRQIGELSGGQQQRVFIARALAMETNLLLLDEPLADLDMPSQQAILDILTGLRPDGVTVLMATHDLSLAAERFDRVMLLNKRLVALGPAADVLTSDNLLAAYGAEMRRTQESNGLAA